MSRSEYGVAFPIEKWNALPKSIINYLVIKYDLNNNGDDYPERALKAISDEVVEKFFSNVDVSDDINRLLSGFENSSGKALRTTDSYDNIEEKSALKTISIENVTTEPSSNQLLENSNNSNKLDGGSVGGPALRYDFAIAEKKREKVSEKNTTVKPVRLYAYTKRKVGSTPSFTLDFPVYNIIFNDTVIVVSTSRDLNLNISKEYVIILHYNGTTSNYCRFLDSYYSQDFRTLLFKLDNSSRSLKSVIRENGENKHLHKSKCNSNSVDNIKNDHLMSSDRKGIDNVMDNVINIDKLFEELSRLGSFSGNDDFSDQNFHHETDGNQTIE